MRHLLFSAPLVAVVTSVALLLSGTTWWVVIGTFFLTAPVMIGMAMLLCNTLFPCDPASRNGPKA